MAQHVTLKAVLLLFLLCCSEVADAQLPDCTNIYLKQRDGIYNYNPLLPVSATNPAANTIHLPRDTFSGLTISPVLGSGTTTATFYTVHRKTHTYAYFDPLTQVWVYTGHACGAADAVNIAAGGPYIFNLVGATGEVYRYDGKGPGELIVTVPGFTGGGPYDLVADCEGNWYILNMKSAQPFLKKYNADGDLLHSWVVHNPLDSVIEPAAGFAIIGTTLYTDNRKAASGGEIIVYEMREDTLEVLGNILNASLAVWDDLGSCAGNVSTPCAVSIKATKTSLCKGSEPVTLVATPLAGGPAPVYQWLVNGMPAAETGPDYTYIPANGDKVVCVMTSSAPCASPPVVSSDTISIVVYEGPVRPPVVSPAVYCKGATPAPLQVRKNVASGKLYWYTAATGGTASLTAPVPSTETTGSFTYYVSEGNGDCESQRVPLVVTVTELIVSGEDRGHPASWTGTDGFIRFKTNQANEVFKIAYRKDNEPQVVLTITSDASGYITIPGLEGGVYTEMTITNANACAVVYSEAIELGFCDGSRVPMPNSFTPNGDHINDVFYVRGSGFTVRRFYIYNRLGNLVFSKENFPPNDPQYGWDGKMNGKVISDTDGFVYMLETVCLGTNTPLLTKGAVLMIK
ncbi:MAG: gliding motility-associated C-terminal domain-containing protein [Chitinophagaceae bacterium]|nr:gliding motility-associated C-terminal domain-containing protein [Chitinophagaceae bacterium]